jgi:hypothetical protein
MCKVIHIKDKTNSMDEVYIGRGSKWGNPFVIGKHGNRDEVIALYEERLLQNNELMDDLVELVDKTLVCFCKPKACHGDVLKSLVDRL